MALVSSSNINTVLITAAGVGLGTLLGNYLTKRFPVA